MILGPILHRTAENGVREKSREYQKVGCSSCWPQSLTKNFLLEIEPGKSKGEGILTHSKKKDTFSITQGRKICGQDS